MTDQTSRYATTPSCFDEADFTNYSPDLASGLNYREFNFVSYRPINTESYHKAHTMKEQTKYGLVRCTKVLFNANECRIRQA